MSPDSPNWIPLGPSATPKEQEALDRLRETLPDDGLTTAWTNLTFIDDSGRIAEVDALILTPAGFFVAELKGWHGTIRGTSQRWQHGPRNVENPLLLTDRKAKRLASLLKSYAPAAQKKYVPFAQPLVILHGEGSTVDLDQYGRTGVVVLDTYKVRAKPPLPRLSEYLAAQPSHHILDLQRIKTVRTLCKKADFQKAQKTRMVGDFAVEDSTPIAQGPDWQDVLVNLPEPLNLKRRLRLFDVVPKAPKSERQRVEQLALREFQLTQGLKHPGITVPTDFKKTDDGPALVFEYDENEIPLEEYLAGPGKELTLDQRVALTDKLGEILRYAHGRRLLHRALSPQRVWVRETKGEPNLTVRDWYAGQRDRDTSGTSRWTTIGGGVADIMGIQNQDDWIWLAPEARGSVQEVPGLPLDVYGYGALTFLILTGKPPATTFQALEEVHATGALDPRRVTTGLPDLLADVVVHATQVVETERPASIEDVLLELRIAWDDVRKPETQVEPTAADALDAQAGDLVADRFEVVARRGEGSSGVALGVRDYDADDGTPERILKVARNDGAGRRLQVEAEVLGALDHPRVVRLVESLTIDGRRALLLSDAGRETLAGRLAAEGRATLGELQQFGGDLIEAMAYLDGKGLSHRDIKPANLGISQDPSTRKRRITLFDFSLAQEPAENLTAGTPGYLDPYLGAGRRRRFDRAAEMWAVSATLFEMATGVPPWWGAGLSVPATASERPVVEPTSFEPAVANQLAEFFSCVLSPDAKERFATFDELDQAWQDVFDSLPDAEDAREQDDARASSATLTTQLAEAGLSARALSGLARLDVVTVGDLLGKHPVEINQVRGLGERYRKEIQRRVKQWRVTLRPASGVSDDDHLGVERVVRTLVGMLDTDVQPLVRSGLGLGTGESARPGRWPQTRELGVAVAQVARVLTDAAAVWAGNTALREAEREVGEILAANARVMTVPELAQALVARRGSTLSDDAERLRYGTALVAAVHVLDERSPDPCLDLRRRTSGTRTSESPGFKSRRPDLLMLIDTADPLDSGDQYPPVDALFEVVSDLSRAAEDMVGKGNGTGVVPQVRAATTLREIAAELPDWDISTQRLLRLSAEAGSQVGISGFEELYPRAMEPLEAVRLVLRGKPGRAFRAESVRAAVRARFPQLTTDLPRNLDPLIHDVFPDLVLRDGVYEPRSTVFGASPTATPLGGGIGSAAAEQLRQRLVDSLAAHRALTLGVPRKHYGDAARALADGFGVEVVDVADLVVRAGRDLAQQMGAQWPGLLGVDAAEKGSPQRERLARFVAQATTPAWEQTIARPEPLLLVNAGPLQRYGLGRLLSLLLDIGTRRPAARWLLVASPDADGLPHGPGGVLDLPRDLKLLTPTTSGARQ
ncbi:BREX system serine/threonine kinase PglW [Promicromonospora sp. NPDC057138]|uniref:BREX system serine/threonine kinase PglW n=1 Tax=Promicromonospora sp. NPDC057138 TaxID=3346031 RepID=UPI0036345AA1